MRVVVTGATGNIGTALLRRLADDVDVVGVARRPPPPTRPYDRADWLALDLGSPEAPRRLTEAAAGADAVVHLAWSFQPSHRRDRLDRTDLVGSRAVLAATRAARVPHLVHMSSVGAYRPAPGRRVGEGWPTDGIDTLPYSRNKVAVERELDALAEQAPDLLVTRLRPGFVLQRAAGSAFARYGLPPWVPGWLLRLLLVLPLDRSLVVPVVHSDDVADAVARVLDQRAAGAFNLATEPPLTRDRVAQVLDAHAVHVPAPLLHAGLDLSWRLRLQPLEPGWLDLAMSVPLLDTSRARTVLGWQPSRDAIAVLVEALGGIADSAGTGSPVLRPRSLGDETRQLLRQGPPSYRAEP